MKLKPVNEHEQKDVDLEGAVGTKMRMLIGPEEQAPTFHMRQFEVAPGGHTPHHSHDFEHEVLILGGKGTVKAETGDRPCQAGDVVYVPPNEKHQFVSSGTEPLSFICLIPAPRTCL
jgi:quercetin dioxygenase-like cupin family protein